MVVTWGTPKSLPKIILQTRGMSHVFRTRPPHRTTWRKLLLGPGLARGAKSRNGAGNFCLKYPDVTFETQLSLPPPERGNVVQTVFRTHLLVWTSFRQHCVRIWDRPSQPTPGASQTPTQNDPADTRYGPRGVDTSAIQNDAEEAAPGSRDGACCQISKRF